MSHPYLPKRKSGTENRFPAPPAVGVWDERPNTHLEILSEAIEVPSLAHRIHSIPDPWARAILFDRALYDKNHILHEQVRGEWRGLLALLGLRERRDFQGLSVREVILSGQLPAAGTFSAIMARLRPSDTNLISADTNWDRLYLVRWQRQPYEQNRPRAFALTSPSTLVCTGADYRNVFTAAEVPWFNDGFLVDPIPHLAARERQALAEWLMVVSPNIITPGRGAARANWIVDRLDDFARELYPAAQAKPAADVLGEGSLGMTHAIYRSLDHPRKREETSLSDVEIVSRQGSARYLLIDPGIASQWNEDAREITIYGDVTLSTAKRLTASGRNSDRLTEGVFWCTPEYFFSDRLIYENNPEAAFPGCRPVRTAGVAQKRNVVLPLTPEVLKLLTPEDVAERFSIEWLPNGGATCYLRLLLKRSNGREQMCTIQKTYAETEMARVANLPLICLWPDFRLEGVNWRAYFTFEAWPDGKEELRVTPWSYGEQTPVPRKHSLDKKHFFHVHQTHSYPEALVCETPYFNQVKQRESIARGLLLPQVPPLDRPAESSTLVMGIDFGSTGSNVYISTGQEDIRPMVFKSRLRQITDFDKTQLNEVSRDFFLPSKDWAAESILSIFHDFGDPPEGDSKREILQDGHVLYADDPRKLISGDRNRVKSNLKWGGERERILARDFLMQLCLQAAAEVAVQGAQKVDTRFSYPTAFSRRDLNQFMAHWITVTRKITDLTGIEFQHNPNKVDNREAVTATRFFSDYTGSGRRLDITGGAITIDIGGGTTDFAVWNERTLLAHSSVIMAGRDILLAPLRKKPQILTEIEPQISLDSLQVGQKDSAFNAQLDAIISRHGQAMIEQLPVRQARPSVQGLLSLIEVGLCGLTFYAGLLVRRLAEAKRFKQGKRISLFVGGNGSKMFSWCALGAPLSVSEIHERASSAFLAGAKLTSIKVEIQLSTSPKSEVAHGLVCEPLPLEPDADDFARPLAGEAFLVGDESKNWNDSVLAADIQKKQVKVDSTFPVFCEFLESIGRTGDEDTLDRIRSYADLRFAQQSQEIAKAMQHDPNLRPDDLIRNEPIFIMALKSYLESEIDAWEQRFFSAAKSQTK